MNVMIIPEAKAKETRAIFSAFFISVVGKRQVGLTSVLVRKNQKWNNKIWLYCSPLAYVGQFIHHLNFGCLFDCFL